MRIAINNLIHFKGLAYLGICLAVLAMAGPLQAIHGSSSNYLHVTGWVVMNDKPLSNTEIIISENGVVLSTMKTNFAGSFSLFVPFQKEYLVTFSKEGLITKKVIIDTKTPVDPDPLFYYYFQFEVELFEDSPYARREFFKDPVAIVFYDAGVHDFEYYRSNVRVFSAKAQNLFKDSLGVAFEYPESFFEYIQSLTERPEQLHMIADKETPEEPTGKEKEADGLSDEIVSYQPGGKEPVAASVAKDQPTVKEPQDIANATVVKSHHNEMSEKNQYEKHIVFYNYLTGELLELGQDKFYTVQLLATTRSVPDGYFDPAVDGLRLDKVIYYRDCDQLHKYTVGVYKNLREAFSVSRKLEEMGYEIFIVAFANQRRLW